VTRIAASSDTEVLYIHAPKLPGWVTQTWREAFASFQVMPVGAVALANLLQDSGFAVTGLNYAMELDLDPDFDLHAWLRSRSAPLLVMIDLHWLEHSFGALEVARVSKEIHPDAPVVLGGLTASLYAAEILREFPQVDYVIRGDAEAGVLGLARHLAVGAPELNEVPNLCRRGGSPGDEAIEREVIRNPLTYTADSEALDRLDFVRLDFLQRREDYYWRQSSQYGVVRGHWLCMGRGCTYDCCWCGGGKSAQAFIAGRNGLALRSPDRLVEDLVRVADLGLDQAALTHDLALGGRRYWEQVLGGLRSDGARIGLWHQQFQLPSDAFLSALADSARTDVSLLELSPLSGNEEVRRLNGKLFSNEEFLHALDTCRAWEIPVFVYFSLNLPGEDDDTYEETLALARRVRDVYPAQLLRMTNMFHTIDPGSAMERQPERFGLRPRWNCFLDYYRYCQLPTEAQDDEAVAALRGFEAVEPRALTRMFEQWVDLCHELGEDTCLHFP
jgi:radical SAM superfamily enzyme YgiQ (UPF0313 family)